MTKLTMAKFKLLSLTILLFFVTSCGLKGIFFSEQPSENSASNSNTTTEQATAEDAATAVTPAKKATKSKKSGRKSTSLVELVWEAPSEPVERYHIAYGTNPTNLDRKVTVPIAEISKVDDPTYGPLFKYILKNVPPKKTIYVSLTAENKSGRSPTSAPFKVEP
jgi:predicted small lipoprotein YifL